MPGPVAQGRSVPCSTPQLWPIGPGPIETSNLKIQLQRNKMMCKRDKNATRFSIAEKKETPLRSRFSIGMFQFKECIYRIFHWNDAIQKKYTPIWNWNDPIHKIHNVPIQDSVYSFFELEC